MASRTQTIELSSKDIKMMQIIASLLRKVATWVMVFFWLVTGNASFLSLWAICWVGGWALTGFSSVLRWWFHG